LLLDNLVRTSFLPPGFNARGGVARAWTIEKKDFAMTTMAKIGSALAILLVLSSCGNTIRGIGRDTANAVNATQDAGRSVGRAATR